MTERFHLQRTEIMLCQCTWLQVDVIVQVGPMPFDAWRIGKHSQRIVIEMHHFVHNFQYDLSSRRFGESPMHGRRTWIYVDNLDFRQGFFHFVHIATFGQYIRYQLEIGQVLVFGIRIVRRVFAVVWKIEQAGRKSFFIDTFYHEFLLLYRQANESVFRGKLDAIHSGRSE